MKPQIHDGSLLAIDSRDSTLRLVVLTEGGGQTYELCFHNVTRLLCDNFLTGNIIFEIQVSFGDRPDKHARILSEVPEALLAKYQTYFEDPETTASLAFLSASYGAELLIAGSMRAEDMSYRVISQGTVVLGDPEVP